MIQPTAATGRVAMIRPSSSSVSPIDMPVLARWKIKPRLMGVPGVANVAIYGRRDRQLQVQGYRPASFIEAALRNAGWAALSAGVRAWPRSPRSPWARCSR